MTFRVSGGCPAAVERRLKEKFIESKFNQMKGRYIEVDGEILKEKVVKRVNYLDPPSPSKDTEHDTDVEAVWQLSVSPHQLSHTPGLALLSDWLVREVALGHIVRQELASMIPALFLQVSLSLILKVIFFSMLLASCVMWSAALDSPDLLESYFMISLA